METLRIPNKSVFKKDEVCSLTGVKPYVLGFWEVEFEQIKPMLSQSGVKLYEESDIEAIVLVKKLLFEDKLTIEKAKQEMARIYTHKIESTVEVNDNLVSRKIGDQDIQKLVSAKEKLMRVIDLTEGVQQRHHWTNF